MESGDEATRPHPDCPSSSISTAAEIAERSKYIPIRLFHDERKYLRLMRSSLKVSQYTDKVDVVFKNSAKRTQMQAQEISAMLSSLAVSTSYEKGQEMVADSSFGESEDYFQAVLEVGRRYKVMNPEKMRSEYGKLVYLLQDTLIEDVQESIECNCLCPIKTVYSTLHEKGCGAMLDEADIVVATGEIVAGNKPRRVIDQEIKAKERAVETLSRRYANSNMNAEQIRQCLYSVGDNNAYLTAFRDPVDKMIALLTSNFSAEEVEDGYELTITEGKSGSRLTHAHQDQYHYVLQSLTLWREIMHDMYRLWYLAEADLLDPENAYELQETGQGLNRMQQSPRTKRALEEILHNVKEKCNWVGDSTIHLGDTNVPNALMFIDKYNQVPRILNPIILTLKQIDETLCQDANLKLYIDEAFGGPARLKKDILCDFFTLGFDGSGADNFFEAGSCIDGRDRKSVV